jgi:hypothetical protein
LANKVAEHRKTNLQIPGALRGLNLGILNPQFVDSRRQKSQSIFRLSLTTTTVLGSERCCYGRGACPKHGLIGRCFVQFSGPSLKLLPFMQTAFYVFDDIVVNG